MVKTTIICDVCKKEIKDKPTYITISEFAPKIFLGVTSLVNHTKIYEICQTCKIYEICQTCAEATYDAWGKIK